MKGRAMSEKKAGGNQAVAVERLAENARQWVASPEGRQALVESQERASKTTTRFREAQRVDPEDLHKPVTL